MHLHSQVQQIGGDTLKVLFSACAGLILLTAAATDVRKGKIPNVLPVLLLFIFFGIETVSFVLGNPIYQAEELYEKITVMLLVFFFLYPFFKIGRLGAGDIKLICTSLLFVEFELQYVFLIFAIGGVAGIVGIVRKKKNFKVHLGLPILMSFCLAVCVGTLR